MLVIAIYIVISYFVGTRLPKILYKSIFKYQMKKSAKLHELETKRDEVKLIEESI
ncbi:hypothetical protein C623_0225735 [Bacillus thuringiensis serovar aizawai str. Hu4-2]|nr:hypothetical protein C623_0225735 [Bacillus thuringiensis serovar aizawai str. Hu4-2]